jgi:hypothetical protein
MKQIKSNIIRFFFNFDFMELTSLLNGINLQ